MEPLRSGYFPKGPRQTPFVSDTKGLSGDGASGWNHTRPHSRQSRPPSWKAEAAPRCDSGQTPAGPGPSRPSVTRGDADAAVAPSLFQKSVVSAACSLTSMADSSDSMSGNSTSVTVVVICGTSDGFRAFVPDPARLNVVAW